MTKKIHIVFAHYGFSKRNVLSSDLISNLENLGFEVSVDQDIYKKSLPYSFLHKIKKGLSTKILYYRFSYINQFKKFNTKRNYKKYTTHHLDQVKKWWGFPFPNSLFLFKRLFQFFKNLPSEVIPSFKPDIVLLFDLQFFVAQNIIKYCKSKGIPIVAVNNSWDHLTSRGTIINDDIIKKILVWNNIQKEEIQTFHHVLADKVEVVGSLQFDSLKKFKNLSKNIKEGKPKTYKQIFLPAYDQRLGKQEPKMVELLLKNKDKISHPFKIIIKPYPNDALFKQRFKATLNCPQVEIVDTVENNVAGYSLMSQLLREADLVITGTSTAAVEAAYYNTALIHANIIEGAEDWYHAMNHEYFYSDHYENIMKMNASIYVNNMDELIKAINTLFDQPNLQINEQNALILNQINSRTEVTSQNIANICDSVLAEFNS